MARGGADRARAPAAGARGPRGAGRARAPRARLARSHHGRPSAACARARRGAPRRRAARRPAGGRDPVRATGVGRRRARRGRRARLDLHRSARPAPLRRARHPGRRLRRPPRRRRAPRLARRAAPRGAGDGVGRGPRGRARPAPFARRRPAEGAGALGARGRPVRRAHRDARRPLGSALRASPRPRLRRRRGRADPGRASRVERADGSDGARERWRITTSEGASLDADAVVLATGGLLGGGIEYTPAEAIVATALPPRPRPPLRASIDAPVSVGAYGRPLEVPGSLFGLAPEQIAWPFVHDGLLERAGVLVDEGDRCTNSPAGLFAAGELVADAPHAWLRALISGARAGVAAARSNGAASPGRELPSRP